MEFALEARGWTVVVTETFMLYIWRQDPTFHGAIADKRNAWITYREVMVQHLICVWIPDLRPLFAGGCKMPFPCKPYGRNSPIKLYMTQLGAPSKVHQYGVTFQNETAAKRLHGEYYIRKHFYRLLLFSIQQIEHTHHPCLVSVSPQKGGDVVG